MPSSYTLGARFKELIQELVQSGRYNNASEVVRDGLRMVEDRERRRGALDTSTENGPAVDGTGAPDPEEARIRTREAMDRVRAFRQTMPNMSVEEILSARHEGHKY